MRNRRSGGLVVVMGGPSDTTAPTVAITSSESSPTAASPIPVTITFSEEVTGFVVGDITPGGVFSAVADFATADNIVFTVNATPTGVGAGTIDIAAGVCQDLAGNDNEAATQFSIESSAVLLANLVGYWSMDELSIGVADVARADNYDSHPASVDTAHCSSVGGKIGSAVNFVSASSQFLGVPDHADLRGGDRDFLWAAWIKITDKTTLSALITKWGSTGNKREYFLYYDTGSDRLKLIVSADGASVAATVTANNLGSPTQGTWYFIEFGYDAANDIAFIRANRGVADTAALAGGIYGSDAYVGFGQILKADGTAEVSASYANAAIDEVWRWNKIPSSAELDYLYNSGTGRPLPASNRMSILGDSIESVAGNWVYSVTGKHPIIHAVSGHNIIANMDAQTVAAASDQANIIIIALGTNDNNAGDMGALQAEAEENIIELKASNPNATLYWTNVLPRWADNTTGPEVDKSNIRTAIAAACTAQGITCWDTYTDPWITQNQTSDGVHPTEAGHAAIAAEVLTRL